MSNISSAGNTPFNSPSSTGGNTAGNTIDRLRDEAVRKANEAEREGQSEAASAIGNLKDQVGAVARDLTSEASTMAGGLKTRALDFAQERKAQGADKLGSFAGTVEEVASNFEEQLPQAAGYIRDAANGINRLSAHIRDRSVEDLTTDARDFAKRQPLLVFGGAIVAGLALARFLKSSKPAVSNTSQRNGDYRGSTSGQNYSSTSGQNYGSTSGQNFGGSNVSDR